MKFDIVKKFSDDLLNNEGKTFHTDYDIFGYLKSIGRFEYKGLIELNNKYSGYFVNKNNLIFTKDSLISDIKDNILYIDEHQDYYGHSGDLKYIDKVFYEIKIKYLDITIEEISKFFNYTYNKSILDGYYVYNNIVFTKERFFEYLDIALQKRGLKNGTIISPTVSGPLELSPSIGDILYIFGYPKDIYGRVYFNSYKFIGSYYYCEDKLDSDKHITLDNINIIFEKLYKNKRFSDYNNHSDWDVSYSISEYYGIIEDHSVITDKRKSYNTSHAARRIGDDLLEEEKKAIGVL